MLVYHHSIYSPADHANDADNQLRRQDFPTAFSNLGVDLVLQGHDHSYSRSYVIKNGEKANPAEQPGAAQVAQGPGGVIYVTANSASGSKYYDLTAPDTTKDPNYGPDPLNPKSHWANSVENQEHVRTLREGPGARRQARRPGHPQRHLRRPPTPRWSWATCRGAARTAAPAPLSRSAPPSTRSSILPYRDRGDHGDDHGHGHGKGHYAATANVVTPAEAAWLQ